MDVCEHVCEQPDLQPYAQSVSSYPRPPEAMRAEHHHPAKSKVGAQRVSNLQVEFSSSSATRASTSSPTGAEGASASAPAVGAAAFGGASGAAHGSFAGAAGGAG